MAGGTWTAQNKVRPGAYINFKAVARPMSSVGTRGIVTFPTVMTWGAEVTELYSTDLTTGHSVEKIGYTAADEEAQVYREALKGAYLAYVYRLDTGGSRATGVLADLELTVTAKYAGTTGNSITVAIKESTSGNGYDVITYFNGAERDRQMIMSLVDLEPNAWVDFSGFGENPEVITEAITPLSGGTNGTITDSTYTNYLNMMSNYAWNTMGIPQVISSTIQNLIISYITDLRENQGKKVQAVMFDVDSDYEGIISTQQGYAMNDEEISPATFVVYVAGLTAGSPVVQSNTYSVILGAKRILYPDGVEPYTHEDYVRLLQQGKFLLSTRQDGAIVIEQDINTMHSFTPDKPYAFSKNRVIRTLDEINNTAASTFEKNYIGKVNNDEDGRNIFKADIISNFVKFQSMGAITNFDSTSDVTVLPGEHIDAVVVEAWIQPVDSMEKLYMTVMVE